jgi:acetylornithine/N-succinyldiaminopimelate aminotransferase
VHGTTYGGNPLAMAVANAVLTEILQENFLENVRQNGAKLKRGLEDLQLQFPEIISDVRGVGLMLGIKISDKIENNEFAKKLIEQGLLTVPASENVVRILPPLNIDESHISEGLQKIRTACENLTSLHS